MRGTATAWAALAGLGAFHGLNPGMGWLFAVALGLQERSRAAVLRALPPIAAGHALSVLAALALLQAVRVALPPRQVAAVAAGVLVGFGVWRLVVRRHPRWVGLRVSHRELVVWSFLMASAHGAGLLLFPVLLRDAAGTGHPVSGVTTAGVAAGTGDLWLVTGVHTAAMLAVMAAVAVWVYDAVGVGVLRRAWFNVELLWPVALVASGVFVAFL